MVSIESTGHSARARVVSASISTKHGIEISRLLRYKSTTHAKQLLEEVLSFKKAVPFRRFKRDMGHKRGMAAGRYPVKAARVFLDLIKSVESNAQDVGLNVDELKISRILANRAAIPITGGRRRGGTKRSHLEVEVIEFAPVKGASAATKKNVASKKTSPSKSSSKTNEGNSQ